MEGVENYEKKYIECDRRFERVENDVFKKLLNISFDNERKPDTLPQVFTVSNVDLYQQDFESLMERIGLDVTIQKTGYDYIDGFTFRVILNTRS